MWSVEGRHGEREKNIENALNNILELQFFLSERIKIKTSHHIARPHSNTDTIIQDVFLDISIDGSTPLVATYKGTQKQKLGLQLPTQ